PAQHHCSRSHEPAEIVHVAVSVVAGDPPAEPDDVPRAEEVAERGFEIGTSQPGIANLNGRIEQAFFGGQQSASTIYINAAALEYQVTGVRASAYHGKSQ